MILVYHLVMLKTQKHQISNFPVIVEKDDDGFYFVNCPFFDGCFSQGKTVEEALDNIKEAITLCLDENKNKVSISSAIADNLSLHFVTI